MKFLRKILMVLAVLFVIPFIVALFMHKDYSVVREITLKKTKQEVFDFIRLLKNQDRYSKWASIDSNMKKEYKGIDGTVGFISAWDSDNNNVGKGEMEITQIKEGERLDFVLHFMKPFEAISTAYMTTDSISEKETKVKWGFNGHMNYPMNFLLLVCNMESMIGKDLQSGLDKLKTVLETK